MRAPRSMNGLTVVSSNYEFISQSTVHKKVGVDSPIVGTAVVKFYK
jgi:hypothetical protein